MQLHAYKCWRFTEYQTKWIHNTITRADNNICHFIQQRLTSGFKPASPHKAGAFYLCGNAPSLTGEDVKLSNNWQWRVTANNVKQCFVFSWILFCTSTRINSGKSYASHSTALSRDIWMVPFCFIVYESFSVFFLWHSKMYKNRWECDSQLLQFLVCFVWITVKTWTRYYFSMVTRELHWPKGSDEIQYNGYFRCRTMEKMQRLKAGQEVLGEIQHLRPTHSSDSQQRRWIKQKFCFQKHYKSSSKNARRT